MPIRYDESRWPFVVVTMPSTDPSDHEFAQHLDHISSYFDRRERFGLIIDARQAPPLNAERRRSVAERLDRDLERDPELYVGTAVVLSSPVGRAVLKVITWMRRSPHPMMAFDALDPGLRWLRGLLLAKRTTEPSVDSAHRRA